MIIMFVEFDRVGKAFAAAGKGADQFKNTVFGIITD